MKTRVVLSKDRDIPILVFLWKWKLATTSAVLSRFFFGRAGATGYKRLWHLQRGGFIQDQPLAGSWDRVWVLRKKGYDAIRDKLPPLVDTGFRSESMSHDLTAMAFQLGDFVWKTPPSVSLFSEQQLRRYDPEFYPSWVPDTKLRRPDGFTFVHKVDGQRVCAIEVELSAKRKADYALIRDYYGFQSDIDAVLWLVPTRTLGRRLFEILEGGFLEKPNKHFFYLYSDFAKMGWQSSPLFGQQTVRAVLGNIPETKSQHVSAHSLLNTYKSPHRSKGYRIYQPGIRTD